MITPSLFRSPRAFALGCFLALAPGAFALTENNLHVDTVEGVLANAYWLNEGGARGAAVRVVLINTTDKPKTYVAKISQADHGVARTVELPAHATRSVELVTPPSHNSYGNSAQVALDGPGTRNWGSGSSGSRTHGTTVLLGPDAFKQGASSKLVGVNETRWDAGDFSEDSRVYGTFDAVVLSEKDWRLLAARPGAAEAFRRYLAEGGRAVLLGAKAEDTLPGMPPLAENGDYGFGRVRFLPSVDVLTMSGLSNPVVTGGGQSQFGLSDGKAVAAVIIIVFAILAGPVNLFVFCRGTRRHRLLWTTPALALGTTLALGGAIYLIDGVGGDNAEVRLRLRPAGTHAEFVHQNNALRLGLMMTGAHPMPEGALVASLNKENSWIHSYDGARYRVEDDALKGDWFLSRSSRELETRLWDAARGGLVLIPAATPGAAPSVRSELDGAVTRALLVDKAGAAWTADNLAPGATVVLRPLTEKAAADLTAEIARPLTDPQRERLNRYKGRRNHYLVETPGLRGSEIPMPASVTTRTRHEVLVGDLAPANAQAAAR